MSASSKRSKRPAPWRGRARVTDPKTKRIALRCTPAQFAVMDRAADKAGLSLGAFARTVLLGHPGPRAVRRPPVEVKELARLLGHIGKVGSNVNMLCHHANRTLDLPSIAELRLMRRDLAMMRIATLDVLGRRP